MAPKRDFTKSWAFRKTPRKRSRRLYRKLAMKHHPDRNQGMAKDAEVKFKGGQGSLRDAVRPPEKRAAYDQYGMPGWTRTCAGPAARAEGFGGFAEAFGDIFGDIFGGQRAGGMGRRPAGVPRQRPELRDGSHARGSRARQGRADPHPHLGRVRHLPWQSGASRAPSPLSVPPATARARCRCARAFSVQQTCPQCRGSGKIIPEPLHHLPWPGKLKKQKTLGQDSGWH